MRVGAPILMVLLVLGGLACGDDTSGPSRGGPGTVVLVLTTPYPDDGGLLIAVTGAGVTGVSSADYEVTYATPTDTGVTLLLRGNLSSGVVAQLTVPDRSRLSRYRVAVQQAASRGPGYQRRSPAAYELRLVKP